MLAEYKLTLTPQTLDNAAPEAKAILERAQAQIGFIPNMYSGMVNVPGLLETYLAGYDAFRKGSGLSPAEQEVVFLTISRENGCEYCMSAHSMIADKMSNVPAAVTDAIRDGTAIADERLAALSAFTRVMVERRGLPRKADVQHFLEAGYTEHNILDIVLAIAVKTISNYSNHLFHTELDEMFSGRKWTADRNAA
ncbi:MAG: carboxymuconolactone decarboxylase family protein [Gammaproteobacteria bacterium]